MYWINELPSEIVELLSKFLDYKDVEAFSMQVKNSFNLLLDNNSIVDFRTSDRFKELLNTIKATKGEEAAGFSADDIAAEGCLYEKKERCKRCHACVKRREEKNNFRMIIKNFRIIKGMSN